MVDLSGRGRARAEEVVRPRYRPAGPDGWGTARVRGVGAGALGGLVDDERGALTVRAGVVQVRVEVGDVDAGQHGQLQMGGWGGSAGEQSPERGGSSAEQRQRTAVW